MKRFLLTLALFGSLLNLNVAWADETSPYNVDFNTAIKTASPKFKVAPGWAHLANLTTDDRQVKYTYHTNGGVDDSGYLEVGSQQIKNSYGELESLHDLLVTPAVNGTSSIKVKKSENKGSIKFYQVTRKNGVYEKGAEITVDVSTLSTSEWTTINLPSQTNQLIGIWGEYVCLDDFQAETADIVMIKELTISKVDALHAVQVDALANGTFPVGWNVKLTNTGDTDIAANDPDFKLFAIARNKKDTVATKQITDPLAAGDTLVVEFLDYISFEKYHERDGYDISENITHTKEYASIYEPVPYKVIYSLTDGATTAVIKTNKTIDFGTSQAEVTKKFYIRNQGAAPLEVEKVEVSDGFTVDIATPFTVEAHKAQEFYITMTNTVAGNKQGTLTIKGTDVDSTYSLAGLIVAEGVWYESFENSIPTNILEGEGWTRVARLTDYLNTNSSTLKAGNPASSPSKLISPLLEVKAGEKLSFSVAKASSDASLVNIYYSADRKNWTKVRTLSDDAENEEDRLDVTNINTTYSPKYHYKNFTVDNIPAGNAYVAFEAGNIYLDDITGYKVVEVAHDVAFNSVIIPANARVNSTTSASATVKNLTDNDEAADSYKAELYLGDELIATADAPAIASGKTATFEFSFTPRTAGNLNAYIKLSGDNFTSTSDITAVNVGEELAEREKQIGTITSTEGTTSPANLYYKNNHSESIYTAEQLGLENGAKITKIIFRGHATSKTYNTNLGLWLQNTTDATYSEPYTATNEADMTNVFNGTYTYNTGGTANNPVDIISIELAEPFVYTGNNLRIRLKSESNGYVTAYFPFDGNINNQTIMRCSDTSLDSKAYSAASTPVVYFNVIGEPNIVSGKIVDEDGNPVAGADVLLKSDNVEYKATTDAEGNYSLSVFKDKLTYTYTITKAGFTPVKETVNPTENIEKNVTLKLAKGFFIDEFTTPETAITNNPLSVSVKAINVLATDLKADAYTATLYVNDEAVATAETKDVKAGETATFSFTYYPHVANAAAEAKVVLKVNDDEAITKIHNINIRKEVAEGVVVVGEVTSTNGYSPAQTNWKHSESQTIYTADMIDLKKGDVITRIAFKGYNGWKAPNISNIKVYIENTTDVNTTTTFAKRDVTEMTELTDVTYNVDDLGTAANLIEKLIINIPDGFVYDGNNIRIAIAMDNDCAVTTWEANSHVSGASWVRYDDNDINNKNFASQNTTPVPYFYAMMSKKVNGTVTDNENNPVANAQVTISDETGHVVYYATTDEDGNYEVRVVQPLLSYKATITANGYKSKTVDVESLVDNPSAEVDAVLEKDTTTGINDITNNKELNDNVYTLSGILVKKAGEKKNLKPGIYIVNHKKVVVK